MRKKVLIFIVSCVVLLGGFCCEPTGTDITETAEKGEKISSLTQDFSEYWPEFEATLVAAGLDPNEFDSVDKVVSKIDIWQPRVQSMIEAAQQGKYTDEESFENLLTAAKVMNLATAQWNPYAPLISKGLEALPWLLTILGGLFTWLFGKKATDRKRAVNEIVDGIEDYKKTGVEAKELESLASTQNATQSEKTRAMIAARKKETAA